MGYKVYKFEYPKVFKILIDCALNKDISANIEQCFIL